MYFWEGRDPNHLNFLLLVCTKKLLLYWIWLSFGFSRAKRDNYIKKPPGLQSDRKKITFHGNNDSYKKRSLRIHCIRY